MTTAAYPGYGYDAYDPYDEGDEVGQDYDDANGDGVPDDDNYYDQQVPYGGEHDEHGLDDGYDDLEPDLDANDRALQSMRDNRIKVQPAFNMNINQMQHGVEMPPRDLDFQDELGHGGDQGHYDPNDQNTQDDLNDAYAQHNLNYPHSDQDVVDPGTLPDPNPQSLHDQQNTQEGLLTNPPNPDLGAPVSDEEFERRNAEEGFPPLPPIPVHDQNADSQSNVANTDGTGEGQMPYAAILAGLPDNPTAGRRKLPHDGPITIDDIAINVANRHQDPDEALDPQPDANNGQDQGANENAQKPLLSEGLKGLSDKPGYRGPPPGTPVPTIPDNYLDSSGTAAQMTPPQNASAENGASIAAGKISAEGLAPRDDNQVQPGALTREQEDIAGGDGPDTGALANTNTAFIDPSQQLPQEDGQNQAAALNPDPNTEMHAVSQVEPGAEAQGGQQGQENNEPHGRGSINDQGLPSDQQHQSNTETHPSSDHSLPQDGSSGPDPASEADAQQNKTNDANNDKKPHGGLFGSAPPAVQDTSTDTSTGGNMNPVASGGDTQPTHEDEANNLPHGRGSINDQGLPKAERQGETNKQQEQHDQDAQPHEQQDPAPDQHQGQPQDQQDAQQDAHDQQPPQQTNADGGQPQGQQSGGNPQGPPR